MRSNSVHGEGRYIYFNYSVLHSLLISFQSRFKPYPLPPTYIKGEQGVPRKRSVYRLIYLFLAFNATFSNISAISWRPVLVMEEAGVPGENHRPWASNW